MCRAAGIRATAATVRCIATAERKQPIKPQRSGPRNLRDVWTIASQPFSQGALRVCGRKD